PARTTPANPMRPNKPIRLIDIFMPPKLPQSPIVAPGSSPVPRTRRRAAQSPKKGLERVEESSLSNHTSMATAMHVLAVCNRGVQPITQSGAAGDSLDIPTENRQPRLPATGANGPHRPPRARPSDPRLQRYCREATFKLPQLQPQKRLRP